CVVVRWSGNRGTSRSFPTRRSSDLLDMWNQSEGQTPIYAAKEGVVVEAGGNRGGYGFIVILDHGEGLQTYYAHMRKIIVQPGQQDRKSTRLNSSHVKTSYAGFCLKK